MATKLELNPIPSAEQQAPAPAPAATPPAATAPSVADIVQNAIASGTDVAALTTLYLKLRGAEADLKDQAKKKLAPIQTGMELIENHFLAKMNELGVDSLKNAAGTPYKTEKTSITVADNSAFVDFVLTRALSGMPLKDEAKVAIKSAIIESGQLALIEARASKTACEQYLQEMRELPAGLNRRSEFAVNVRAS